MAALIGYVLGSIPFGLIAGRLARGVDVRDFGSRRTGGTNVMRVLGARWAILVTTLDAGKGALAAILGRASGVDSEAGAALAAFAAAAGHIYPIFARFRGGRGVATLLGGLSAIFWPAAVAAIAAAMVVIWRTRYVSLGSLIAAVTAVLAVAAGRQAALVGWPSLGYAVVTAVLVAAVHHDNIQRLRAGTERRIGRPSPTSEPADRDL